MMAERVDRGSRALTEGRHARRSWAPVLIALALLGLFGASAGCSKAIAVGTVGAGYVTSPSSNPGRSGPQVSLNFGGGADQGIAGLGPAIRMKFTPNVTEVAIAVEGFVIYTPWFVSPMARFGVHFLQFASIDDTFGFGMFSPYLEAGFAVLLGRGDDTAGPFMLSVLGTAEATLRYTGQSSEFNGGVIVAIGVGMASW